MKEEINFGLAIEAMKKGLKVARKGWNGKGMWLSLVKNGSYDVACGVFDTKECNPNLGVTLDPWIGMKTASNSFVPWLASQADILSNDWIIVD